MLNMLNMFGFVEYFEYVEVYILNIKGFTINGEEETIGSKKYVRRSATNRHKFYYTHSPLTFKYPPSTPPQPADF